MNIVWHYLEKRKATINALKDYHHMEYIIENTPISILGIREGMESPGSISITGLPKAKDPKASGQIADEIHRFI